MPLDRWSSTSIRTAGSHWRKAAAGKPDGEPYRQVLADLLTARDAGLAVFPLSATHYAEMANNRNRDQRAGVARIMERLSGFSTLVNDIHDIDALSIAVPYCDVVVTEKYAHKVLTTAQLHRRTGTVILRRLEDLPSRLAAAA